MTRSASALGRTSSEGQGDDASIIGEATAAVLVSAFDLFGEEAHFKGGVERLALIDGIRYVHCLIFVSSAPVRS